MYLFNPKKAEWIAKNRDTINTEYDDEDVNISKTIDVIPFNVDQAIQYGIYTVPEATGYFIIRKKVNIREGDQIVFNDRQYSVLKVVDEWIFNSLESIEVVVK